MTEEREVNGNQAGNNMELIGMNHQDVLLGNSSSVSNKRRKKQSKVWEEMTKFTGEDGRDWAGCNHCQKVFDGSSKKGTTHLNNHLQRCPRKRNIGAGDDNADKRMDQTANLTSPVVIGEKSVIDLIKSCFDENGELTENWDPFVLNSRRGEILKVYEEKKEELRRFYSRLSCRLCIVIRIYAGFYVLSAHYVDDSWEPKMDFISICAVNEEDEELHHNNRNLVKVLNESCLDLKIDGDICSIIYCDYDDDAFPFFKANHEDVIGEINSWFNQRGNSLPFGGLQCSYDTLAYIYGAIDCSLGECLWEKFGEIIKCIDYVKSTPWNRQNFQIAKDKVRKKVEDFGFLIYMPSISDFGNAVGYKEAFLELELIDSDFKSRSINLTEEQWDEATAMHQHCKEFLDSFDSLAKSEYTTLNQYFPNFCDVYMKLVSLRQMPQTSTVIKKLSSELEKYNLVLVIAVILDPRFKMDIVQLWYNKIYGRDSDRYLEKIIHDFTDVYNKYYAKVSESEDTTSSSSSSYLDAMGRPSKSSPKSSSELERYLNESKVPSVQKFDILAWWRAYAPIFPTLSRMARDFLAIPLKVDNCYDDTVDSDIFKREDLDEDIKPALLCLTRWFE